MEYIITPHGKERTNWCWFKDIFSDEELSYLQKIAVNAQQTAQVGRSSFQEKVRRSEVDWIGNSPETKWVFQKLASLVSEANAKFFNFDLSGFGEKIQLTNYKSEVEGTYDWHQDFGSKGPSRKLSLVMQLTDPSQYEGGNLEIVTGAEPTQIPKQRGFICIFPAWTLHRVTPVTQGERQSLVAWISGPDFK